MSKTDRARQFLPFNALKGYYDVIKEHEKIVEERRMLSEEAFEALSKKVLEIKKNDMVTISHYSTYSYIKTQGIVSKIDINNRFIVIVKTKIIFDDIIDIEITN